MPFHLSFILIKVYIIRGKNERAVGGHSIEMWFYPIGINVNDVN
jgi:hypothetical protein